MPRFEPGLKRCPSGPLGRHGFDQFSRMSAINHHAERGRADGYSKITNQSPNRFPVETEKTSPTRDMWSKRVARLLQLDDPDQLAAGLPFEHGGIQFHFLAHPDHGQALLLATLPAPVHMDASDLHAGLLHLQLMLWADASLLFGLDIENGALYAGTRIDLHPLPMPDEVAGLVHRRAKQAARWTRELTSQIKKETTV